MTAVPSATMSGTRPAAAPWGRARKTASASGRPESDGQPGRGQVRVVATDRVGVAVATGEPDDLDVRMAGQDADQLAPTYPVAPMIPTRIGRVPDERSVAIARSPPPPLRSRARARRCRSTAPLTGGRARSRIGIGWTVVMGA